jgi:spore coat polysaccharide biosynthesis predicted glycosyltransferase SpsG
LSKKKLKILLFCHGDESSGLGHLSRSFSFVSRAEKNYKYEFMVAAMTMKRYESFFNNLKSSIKYIKRSSELLDLIAKFSPKVIIFDTLALDKEILKKIKSLRIKLVSISPIFDCNEYMDLIFTRAELSPKISSFKNYSGIKYTVINENIPQISTADFKTKLFEKKLNVGFSLGGSDASNNAKLILNNLTSFQENCRIWFLIGEGYSHCMNELIDITRRSKNVEIILVKANQSMWEILQLCSLVIVSGGLTLLECSYSGLPTLNFFLKKEHRKVALPLVFESKMSIDIGDFSKSSITKIKRKIKYFNRNRNELLYMHKNTKKIKWEDGASNILMKIEKHC